MGLTNAELSGATVYLSRVCKPRKKRACKPWIFSSCLSLSWVFCSKYHGYLDGLVWGGWGVVNTLRGPEVFRPGNIVMETGWRRRKELTLCYKSFFPASQPIEKSATLVNQLIAHGADRTDGSHVVESYIWNFNPSQSRPSPVPCIWKKM